MMNLFPLLIILLIMIVFAIRKGTRISFISAKYKKYLVIIYCIILVISTISICFIPKDNFIKSKDDNIDIINKLSDLNYFKDLVVKNKLNTSNYYIKKGAQSFDYSEDTLTILNPGMNIRLVVLRKDIDDKKIEVTDYVNVATFNGLDITDKIKPCSLNLADKNLTASIESSLNLTLYQFKLDITTHQFINNQLINNQLNDFSLSSLSFSAHVLLIKIPKNLQLDTASTTIEMIN